MDDLKNKGILDISDNEYNVFLKKPNVVGVALSTKRIKGVDTGEEVIQVLVQKKVKKDELDSEGLVPDEYKGFKTDVIETGRIRFTSFTNRVRPMPCGYSVGPAAFITGGTAACLVYDDKGKYILSNNHVLASENRCEIGAPILQPAEIDGGVYPKDVIATLDRFIPYKFSTPTENPENYVDVAIAKIKDIKDVSSNLNIIGGIKGTRLAILNLPVKKVGRTSEVTNGIITSIGATVSIDSFRGVRVLFKDQIMTTVMGSGGDSGSLLVDNFNNAVGLLFAGSDNVTIFNPIEKVLKYLNVKLVLS